MMCYRLAALVCLHLLLALSAAVHAAEYVSHTREGPRLTITTDEGRVDITAYRPDVFEVHYQVPPLKQLPSFAVADSPVEGDYRLTKRPNQLRFSSGELTAVIDKSPLRVSFVRAGSSLLEEEIGYFGHETIRGFRFELEDGERLIGAGQRVLGMDRRGHRLPLYNKAHYGYETESEQMYFSIPGVLSDRGYMLVFDNSASGFIDIGKTESDVLQFEAVGGRTSYLVFAGSDYQDILGNYAAVTGHQPMPPRWALGNYASRFGYHDEAETRAVVQRYLDLDFPLDAVVLDLYWFGPDIKGHVGNLDWDREAFPTPEDMIADFSALGVNTVLITEPFVLTTSKRWDEAVAADVLAKSLAGESRRFDFYFGNTGLIDVFSQKASDWMWDIYAGLMRQGVAGHWGDLGEPEVHPGDSIHAIGTGDEVHNAFGHRWAELIFEGYERDYPERRPFIMMRSGFPGSQRFGMIPWTGDVSRSWGGLQSQVELSLQMGLMGMGYIHSDLGGFAGGEVFDPELYLRWMQLGVFQPVFRPHAQEHIPSEPVFHDEATMSASRELTRLRYRMLPYNYTLSWENSISGLPLARPLFYEDDSPRFFENKDSFMWGDAFMVTPVVHPGRSEVNVDVPEGVWFDYWDDTRIEGQGLTAIAVTPDTFPVLVKAGSFVPMTGDMMATRDYNGADLKLHYYADASVRKSSGVMYEDDGLTHNAFSKGEYELLEFNARQRGSRLKLDFSRSESSYPGAPDRRNMQISVHNWLKQPRRIGISGSDLPLVSEREFEEASEGAFYEAESRLLHIKFVWQNTGSPSLEIR